MSKPFYKNLTVQVLTAVAIGATIATLKPDWGIALRPLGDAFIRLVKMVVTPIIFLTVVAGIAGIGDLKKAGRVGLKALIYFEIVTTLALAIGLTVGNVARPGGNIDRSKIQVNEEASRDVPKYQAAAENHQDSCQCLIGGD